MVWRVSAMVLLLVFSALARPAGAGVAEVWTVQGCEAPESACYDAQAKAIYVSNVVGSPIQKDGNGYLQKLSLAGRVLAKKWVAGFNAPKGMRLYQGKLYVADIDQLVVVDVEAAKIVQRVAVPGARFLNDVAVGSDGTVYVSDTLDSSLFQVRGNRVSRLAEGKDLESPNGLLVEKDRLVIAAWGVAAEDFSTKTPGRILGLNLTTKKLTPITLTPLGNLDGIESDGADGYYATDWVAGKVLHVPATGESREVITGLKGPADLAVVPSEHLLVVPRMNENLVTAYDLRRLPRGGK